MEQTATSEDSLTRGTEGCLREMALKWFTETQAPLILHNGLFPTWFHGCITRKEAEETLCSRELGCFLIRLSDKAKGYILSYKGKDRCRHFVINQVKSGQLIVSGDTAVHGTLSGLIEHYKKSPIEPFGEYLTSSCYDASSEEFYDTIQVSPKDKPSVNIRDMRTWCEPPTLPPKTSKPAEEAPPLPKRDRRPKSGFWDDRNSAQATVLYAQLEKFQGSETPMGQYGCPDRSPGGSAQRTEQYTTVTSTCRREKLHRSNPRVVSSDLKTLDSRSRSLPVLDQSSDELNSYRLNAGPYIPPRLSPKPPRQEACNALVLEQRDTSRPTSSHSLDYICNSPIYHLAGRPGGQVPNKDTGTFSTSNLDRGSMYAEVPGDLTQRHFLLHNTYEDIPEHGLIGEAAKTETNSNVYESLENLKPKHAHTSWGLKTDKWKRLLPEIKRK